MSSSSISIILPVYNGERYLRQSIQSILDQTFNNWELLIIDDCSTDSTPQIIAEYCSLNPRIRSFRHDKNQRLPGTLNTGFRKATGKYVTWTSDDNLYRPTALQEMATFLDNNPDVDFVYTDYDLINENGDFIKSVSVSNLDEQVFGNVIGGSFLYRFSIHETIGYYDENTFLAEDLDFELRTLVSGFHIMPLHKNLYQYRDHPGTLTSTKKSQINRAHAEVIKRYYPKMTWLSRETKSRSFLHLARKAFSIRDFSAAILFMIEGFRQAPVFMVKFTFIYPFLKKNDE